MALATVVRLTCRTAASQLFIGLTLYGVSTAMFVRADLGADPWNVFHLGVANLLSMNIGVVIIAVGVLVLLAWIP
ncbi:hypothetical protein EOL32_26265, partial [Citrobacter freundii]